MSESNNPVTRHPAAVTQQPGKPAFTRTARLGILAGMVAMIGIDGSSSGIMSARGRRGCRRHGKHNGQTKGAFGKQR